MKCFHKYIHCSFQQWRVTVNVRSRCSSTAATVRHKAASEKRRATSSSASVKTMNSWPVTMSHASVLQVHYWHFVMNISCNVINTSDKLKSHFTQCTFPSCTPKGRDVHTLGPGRRCFHGCERRCSRLYRHHPQ